MLKDISTLDSNNFLNVYDTLYYLFIFLSLYNLSPCSLVQFKIFTSLENQKCEILYHLNEGVEFSVRTSVEKDWIPLLYLYPTISRGNVPNRIRGYDTFMKQEIQQKTTSIQLEVCDITLTDTVQLRWLQFTRLILNMRELKNVWALDDINIALLTETNESKCIVSDSFQNVTKRKKIYSKHL